MLSGKSKFIAESSLWAFLDRNPSKTYFITFSEPGRVPGESLWSKDEAEKHFKPFRDYCFRTGVELIVVWQLQKRGSWHPHCLVNRRFDVNWLRPWMRSRGWGPQMRLEFVYNGLPGGAGNGLRRTPGVKRLVGYLVRYLMDGAHAVGDCTKKKLFGGCHRTKVGTTNFKWMPEERPGAFLYASGRELFSQLYGHPPSFRDMGHVVRLGVENTNWAERDFLWEFSVPGG